MLPDFFLLERESLNEFVLSNGTVLELTKWGIDGIYFDDITADQPLPDFGAFKPMIKGQTNITFNDVEVNVNEAQGIYIGAWWKSADVLCTKFRVNETQFNDVPPKRVCFRKIAEDEFIINGTTYYQANWYDTAYINGFSIADNIADLTLRELNITTSNL